MHWEICTSAAHHPPDATDGAHNDMSHCFQPVESLAIQDVQTHYLKILKLGLLSTSLSYLTFPAKRWTIKDSIIIIINHQPANPSIF
jgi:hypothetical protein